MNLFSPEKGVLFDTSSGADSMKYALSSAIASQLISTVHILSNFWVTNDLAANLLLLFCQITGLMYNSDSINRLFPHQESELYQMYHLSKEVLYTDMAFWFCFVLRAVCTWKRSSPLRFFALKVVYIIAYEFLHNATFSYEHTQVAFVLQMYAGKTVICTSEIDKGLHKFMSFGITYFDSPYVSI